MIVHRTFGLEVLQLILASKLSELEQDAAFSMILFAVALTQSILKQKSIVIPPNQMS